MSASAVGGKEKNGDINQVPYNVIVSSIQGIDYIVVLWGERGTYYYYAIYAIC